MKVKKIITHFFANQDDLPLERRLLLSTLIAAVFIGATGAISNLFLTTSIAASVIPLIMAVVAGVLYYLLRYKEKYKFIPLTTAILGILGVSTIWIFNGGIDGPNIMFSLAFLILWVIIVSDKIKKYIIAFFILVNFLLLLIQLYRPDLITTYPSEFARWADILFGTIFSSLIVFFTIQFIHKHYLLEKKKAEENDQLKSAFLANMSHEIRTPMNGIMGFADLLKEPALSGEQQQKYIRIIEKAGFRMLNIINDIVNISKIEAGQMQVAKTETNINAQMEYIYTFFKSEIERKGIKFSFFNALAEKEAIITTDPEKLYAILTNLVKNAIKFTREGSIEFGYEKKEKQLEFYVRDTGKGIPHDKKSVIFNRFMQAGESYDINREGTGLGLSISKAYAEMLGGKLWVESEEGIGSIFYFTLPYNTKPTKKM